MSTWMVSVVLGGALVGLAMAMLCLPLLPSVPRLGPALEQLSPRQPTPSTGGGLDRKERIGAWLLVNLPAVKGLALPTKDLALVGITPQIHLFTKAAGAAIAAVALGLSATVGLVIAGFPVAVPLGFALVGAVAMWFAPDLQLRERAEEARRNFSRAVAVYLELVAAERRRDAPAAVALESAATVSNAWIFQRIRQELARARLDHVQPWDALIELSRRIGVPELEEASKIIRLSGQQGAQIYEALRNSGQSLRVKLLTDEHVEANKASEGMSTWITILAVVFLGVIMTPLLLNLLST